MGAKLSMTKDAIRKRKERAKLYASGKTCLGKPRRNRRFPELHGLNDERLWQKLYETRRLTA